MAIEDMEGLARRLAQEKNGIYQLAGHAAKADLSGWQALTWARGLVIAAVRVFDWKKPEPLQYKFQRWRISKVHCRRRVSDFT